MTENLHHEQDLNQEIERLESQFSAEIQLLSQNLVSPGKDVLDYVFKKVEEAGQKESVKLPS